MVNNMGTRLSTVREWLESVIAHVLRNRTSYLIGTTLAILAGGWTWAFLAGSGRGIFVMIIAVIVGILVILRIVRGSMDRSTDQSLPPKPDTTKLDVRLKRLLSPGEIVHFESREHPIVVWKAILAIPASIGLFVLFASQGALKLGFLVWLVATAWAGWKLLMWGIAISIYVTNKRIWVSFGLFNRRFDKMPLNKITDMSVLFSATSGALARLRIIEHEYGAIRLESAGQDQAINRLVYIPDGFRFNRLLSHLA